jgi:hypothetical protein
VTLERGLPRPTLAVGECLSKRARTIGQNCARRSTAMSRTTLRRAKPTLAGRRFEAMTHANVRCPATFDILAPKDTSDSQKAKRGVRR